MEQELLHKLLPHEYHGFYIKNGSRVDSRSLTQHRPIAIKRGVLAIDHNQSSVASFESSNQIGAQYVKVSAKVSQGNTLIIGQGCIKAQDSAVYSDKPLTIQVQLPRELQSHIRRDFQEQKEICYSQHIIRQVESVIDFTVLTQNENASAVAVGGTGRVRGLEIGLNFNLLTDDGNLVSAISAISIDMLLQLEKISGLKFLKQLGWESLIIKLEGQLISDPTLEESYVSNNHLAVCIYEDGNSIIEKSLSLRTYTNQINSLEYGEASMTLDDLSNGINYISEKAKQVFATIKDAHNKNSTEYIISL